MDDLDGLDGLDFVMMDEPPIEPPERRVRVKEVVREGKGGGRKVVQIEIDDSDEELVVRGKKKGVKKEWGGGEVIVLD